MSLAEVEKIDSALTQSECCNSSGRVINYAQPQTGEVCVDLGSDRGTDVFRMAEDVGSNGFVYGIDLSDAMIQKAFKTAEILGVTNVNFIKSTLKNLKLGSNLADLVTSNCIIDPGADKQTIWSEIYRILKKGGRFVVSDIYATSPIPDEYRADPEAIAECWAGAVTRGEYLEILYKAGFTSVRIIEESSPYSKGKAEVSSFTITGEKPGEKKYFGCRG